VTDLADVETTRLPDIDDVRPYGPDDDACFDDLRAVLEKHGALNRFGITLLHQHFDLRDDEVIVENVDKENRILLSTPVQSTGIGNSVETSWRFEEKEKKKKQKVCESRCNTTRDPFEGKETHVRQHYTVS
jgi:hypothetical protein